MTDVMTVGSITSLGQYQPLPGVQPGYPTTYPPGLPPIPSPNVQESPTIAALRRRIEILESRVAMLQPPLKEIKIVWTVERPGDV